METLQAQDLTELRRLLELALVELDTFHNTKGKESSLLAAICQTESARDEIAECDQAKCACSFASSDHHSVNLVETSGIGSQRSSEVSIPKLCLDSIARQPSWEEGEEALSSQYDYQISSSCLSDCTEEDERMWSTTRRRGWRRWRFWSCFASLPADLDEGSASVDACWRGFQEWRF
eukprot:gnl/TRDRNA2_/TRDRNA2_130127_c0_seq1.p1 gnl/TRDRNA2_/TRDRNA2_130127_c0~~gnl/TRDRNA2_/TRDRNA2_130127_c0_seq1.p1  ORF type:complete len:177 (-),score=21.22 gnl/TRDRNA2_/TRDRNA2_130127_c0_seq1:239-769(-)